MRSSKRLLLVAAAPFALCAATPAFAKWETIHGYPADGKCFEAHQVSPDLRANEGRAFEVPAGFSGLIEIYGQGIDFSPDARVSGLPAITEARIEKRVSGPENLAAGCGAIGSVVVALKVSPNVAPDTGTLYVGTEVVPLAIVTAVIDGASWSTETTRGANRGGGQAPPPPPPPPSQPNQVTSTSGNGCSPSGSGCSNSSGLSINRNLRGANSGPSEGYIEDPEGIGKCIGIFGGDIDLQPRTLTIRLPRTRSNAALDCLTRPAYIVIAGEVNEGDVTSFRAPAGRPMPSLMRNILTPRYSGATSGFNGPTPMTDLDTDFLRISMTNDLAANFVGTRRVELTSTTPRATPLTLILQSYPNNGIRSISVPGSRTAATMKVRFDFLAALDGPQEIAWKLMPASGVGPAQCFTAAAGRLTVTSTIGELPITSRERPECIGASFELQMAPAPDQQAVFEKPYMQAARFTLTAATAPTITPGGMSLPPRPF